MAYNPNGGDRASEKFAYITDLSSDINLLTHPKGEAGVACFRITVPFAAAGTVVVTKLDGTDETLPELSGDAVFIVQAQAIKSTSTATAVLVQW